jgi:hypothetical protein
MIKTIVRFNLVGMEARYLWPGDKDSYVILAQELYDDIEISNIISTGTLDTSNYFVLKDLPIQGTTSLFYDNNFKLRNLNYQRNGNGEKTFSFLVPLYNIVTIQNEPPTEDEETSAKELVHIYYKDIDISNQENLQKI